jgi:hypothetical protein
MREYELFLNLMAEHVYTAKLANGLPIRDAYDFQLWLRESAARVGKAQSLEEFFRLL